MRTCCRRSRPRNEGLAALHEAGRLAFFGDLAPLADKRAFDAVLAPLRRSEWVVYAKRPFAGPKAVLAYLARYTHRVAISNSRLLALDQAGVTFKWKDYRIKGRDRLKTMMLNAAEFIRRFLLHVLPSGLPPHPPLRPLRRRASSPQHRARPPIAGRARALARRGGQRGRIGFACAPLSVLRRPDDHPRNLRRRAPRALAFTDPKQDRI
jgi:putative transposase